MHFTSLSSLAGNVFSLPSARFSACVRFFLILKTLVSTLGPFASTATWWRIWRNESVRYTGSGPKGRLPLVRNRRPDRTLEMVRWYRWIRSSAYSHNNWTFTTNDDDMVTKIAASLAAIVRKFLILNFTTFYNWLKYSQFIRTEGWFCHPVTNTKLFYHLVFAHGWVWNSTWGKKKKVIHPSKKNVNY